MLIAGGNPIEPGNGASPFEALAGAPLNPTPALDTTALLQQPVFDTDDDSTTEALEAAVVLAAIEAEEADLASASSSSSLLLPAVTYDDVVMATANFLDVLPDPAHGARAKERGVTGATRGRSLSLKRPNPTGTRRGRASSQKKPKLDEKYLLEYAQNVQRLLEFGITKKQQFDLERGLSDEDIIGKQKEILTGLNLRRSSYIAPKPASASVFKKGAPGK